MNLFKTLLNFGFIILLVSSCKKPDSNTSSGYPKNVSITYRVSSLTTNSLISITFSNESGGLSTTNNPTLPYTKSISRTVTKNNIITLGYFVNPAQSVRLEILVNNEVVKSQEFNSPNSSMSYTFL